MLRPIAAFRLDDEGHWVAALSCGHARHVRHRPPWQVREWVTTEAGRAGMLGRPLDCIYCDIPEVPDAARAYKRTAEWTEDTLPAALQARHDTKAGVWARIVVVQGRVTFEILAADEPSSPDTSRPDRDTGTGAGGDAGGGADSTGAGTGADRGADSPSRAWVLRPGIDGVAPPRVPHRLTVCGPVRLYVEFWRIHDPTGSY